MCAILQEGTPEDTHSEMLWQDLKSICFVCNVDRFRADQDGIGFDKHVKSEHDPRMYLFFIIHLRRKSRESMVSVCTCFLWEITSYFTSLVTAREFVEMPHSTTSA